MIRKSLLAASVMVLALGAGKAASAEPVFLEPYGELNSARTFSSSPADSRPKDALQGQNSGEGAKANSFIISPTAYTDHLTPPAAVPAARRSADPGRPPQAVGHDRGRR